MAHTVRAVGTVAADERRIGVVNPKFEGWIEQLHVNTTGQTVRRGEPLLEIYSPDLVLAQRVYLVARSAAADMAHADAMARDNANAIAAAALSRLKNWDISADQLARLQRSGSARAHAHSQCADRRHCDGKTRAAKACISAAATCSIASSISRRFGCWRMCYEQDLAQIRPGQTPTDHSAGLSRPRL